MKLLMRIKCALFGHDWKAESEDPAYVVPDWNCACGAHEAGFLHPNFAKSWSKYRDTFPPVVMDVNRPSLRLVSAGPGRQSGMPPIPVPPPVRIVTHGIHPDMQEAHNKKHQLGRYAPHYLALLWKYDRDLQAYEARRTRSQSWPV